MAFLAKGDLLVGDFLLTKQAAALSPKYAMIATDPRRQLSERIEAAKSAEALSVGLNQPHRQGNPGRDPGSALRTFCRRQRLRQECLRAGEAYTKEVRAEKAARGFHVIDQVKGEGDELTEAQLIAKNELAIAKFNISNMVLVAVGGRLCPIWMQELCYDELEPSPYREGVLVHGLVNLSIHYGLLDQGINRDKPI